MTSDSGAVVTSVARMYYLDGLGQSEIASIVGVSRSTVSRLLTAARDRGIVRISVDDFDPRDRDSEAALQSRFGLRQSVVIRDIGNSATANMRRSVGYFAAPVMAEVIAEKQLVGLAGGRTLCELVHNIDARDRPGGPTFVQLMGSIGSSPDRIDGSELARTLARRFNGTFQTVNAPSIVQSIRARELFLAHREIQSVLGMYPRLDLALVGIGTLDDSAFRHRRVLSNDEFEEARAAGAVGELGGRFFDSEGMECSTSMKDRVICIDFEALRACPDVVAVSTGADRASALLAAISGRLITSLVCDEAAARALLALAR